MFWEAFSVSDSQLSDFFLRNESFENTHIFYDFAFTVANTIFTVKTMLEDTFVRIQRVYYRICVALFVLSEDCDITQLTDFE